MSINIFFKKVFLCYFTLLMAWSSQALATFNPIKNGIYKLAFEAGSGEYKPVVIPEMLVRVKSLLGTEVDRTYLFEVLYVYQQKDSFIKTVVDQKTKPLRDTAIKTLKGNLPNFMLPIFAPLLEKLSQGGDLNEVWASGNSFVVDQKTLDYHLPNQPELMGMWKVGLLTSLKQESLKLLNLTNKNVESLSKEIKNNIYEANNLSYKFGYSLGVEITDPTVEAVKSIPKLLAEIAQNVNSSDAKALVQIISGLPANLAALSPSIKNLDFASIFLASKNLSVALSSAVNNDFLSGLSDKIKSMAWLIPSSIFSLLGKLDLASIKNGVDSVQKNLSFLTSKVAKNAYNALFLAKSEFASIDESFMTSSVNLIKFLQLKSAYEDAQIIYDAEKKSESAINKLTETIINAETTFSGQIKVSFIEGLKSGAIFKLSNERLDLKEVDVVIASMKAKVATATTDFKRAQTLMSDVADVAMKPGITNSISLVKNLIGLGTDIVGYVAGAPQSVSSAHEAIIRLLVRGLR